MLGVAALLAATFLIAPYCYIALVFLAACHEARVVFIPIALVTVIASAIPAGVCGIIAHLLRPVGRLSRLGSVALAVALYSTGVILVRADPTFVAYAVVAGSVLAIPLVCLPGRWAPRLPLLTAALPLGLACLIGIHAWNAGCPVH